MVAEWIDGVRLSDRPGIERLMGDDANTSPREPLPADRFPALKGGTEWVMQTMVDLFSAQIFDWGWVHCDPHPGNIIIRPHPNPARAKKGQAQFVLLDHGLYVRVTDGFQQQVVRVVGWAVVEKEGVGAAWVGMCVYGRRGIYLLKRPGRVEEIGRVQGHKENWEQSPLWCGPQDSGAV